MRIKIAAAALAAGALSAQPAFEVATVKVDTVTPRGWSMPPAHAGKFTATNVTLAQLVATAWRVQDFQVAGVKGWMRSERYDVVAKAADASATTDQVRLMLQALLADRFRLAVHRETKDQPLYALVVSKRGPKLQKAQGCSGEAGMKNPCGGFALYRRSQLTGLSVTVAQLAEEFPWLLQRPVVDKTGLTGLYDIKLQWSAEHLGIEEAGAPQPEAADQPSLFTAVEEQLGLRLEAQRGPVEVVVIDRAERPSEN